METETSDFEGGSVAEAASQFAALRAKASEQDAAPSTPEGGEGDTQDTPEQQGNDTVPADGDGYEEVEFNGAKYKVPTELKSSIMMDRDYRVKTGKLADETRKWEAEKKSYIENATQAYKSEVQRLQQLLAGSVTDEDSTLMKLLEEENYPEYIKQKHLSDQRKVAVSKANEELKNQQLQQFQEYFKTQQEQLHAKLPEWKDPEKAKKQFDSMSRFLQSEGFSQEEIGRTYDHRLYLISLKAMKFDELEKAKKDAVKKIEKLPPKAERPGVPSAANGVASKDALSRLRKTGSLDDAAAAIRSLRAGNA